MNDDRFPSAPQTFFLLLALFVAEYLVAAALHDFRDALNLSPNELDVFVTLLGNATVFTVLMHLKRMSYAELFHASRSSVRATLALLGPPILLVVPALVLVAWGLTDVLAEWVPLSQWEEQAFSRMSANTLPAIVATCLLAPVLEEMLFRGIVLRAFLHRYPKWQAILGSALFFGFAHLNIYQFVVAFMLGALAGWLYERTRSLVPCIVLHGCYNASIAVLQATADSGSAASPARVPLIYWAMVLGAAALGGHLLRRLLETRPASAALEDSVL